MLADYAFYWILDIVPGASLPALDDIVAVLNSGITCVQLRMKQATLPTVSHAATRLLSVLKPKNIPLIINDYWQVVKNSDAAGLHIGQSDISYSTARHYLGYQKIIGLSIENYQQAVQCNAFDVDYFGVGPIFPTQTLTDAAPAIGIPEFLAIRQQLTKPIIAIGGINESNIHAILNTGKTGIALASAIMTAPEPVIAAQKIAAIIAEYRQ